MTTTPRLNLPEVSIRDAGLINDLIDAAEADLRDRIAKIRTLLQQRNLLGVWDEEKASFTEAFLPLADRYHDLQNALLELTGEQFGQENDLSTYVEAQR